MIYCIFIDLSRKVFEVSCEVLGKNRADRVCDVLRSERTLIHYWFKSKSCVINDKNSVKSFLLFFFFVFFLSLLLSYFLSSSCTVRFRISLQGSYFVSLIRYMMIMSWSYVFKWMNERRRCYEKCSPARSNWWTERSSKTAV